MKYQVELSFTQHGAATITIDAESLEQAEQLADELRPDDIQDWRAISGDVQVIHVAEAPAAHQAPPSLTELARSLAWIVEHFINDEAADYRNRDSAEERDGHIYNALRTVARWLKHYTPA